MVYQAQLTGATVRTIAVAASDDVRVATSRKLSAGADGVASPLES
jgi:hypothetical protein